MISQQAPRIVNDYQYSFNLTHVNHLIIFLFHHRYLEVGTFPEGVAARALLLKPSVGETLAGIFAGILLIWYH